MGFLSKTFNLLFKISGVLLAVTFIPGIPPHLEFEAYSVTPLLPLEGPLALNNKLNNAEKLFVNELIAPEHLEVHNGMLYTAISTGYVVKIVDGKVIPVVKFGKEIDGVDDKTIRGRPLGLGFDSKGIMYAIDTYYGIFKVNVSSGTYEQLVSMDTKIDGKYPKLPNSVAVAKDGTLYWSDSTTAHSPHDALYTLLDNGTGRLLKYDPKTKTNSVLIDKLHFANGVVLSHDESFVLVSDMYKHRILKYNLKGSMKGKTEVFVDGLPGFPDNIHSDKNGEFHVTLPMGFDKENPSYPMILGPYPIVRKLFARLLYLLEFPALQINKYYPNYYSKAFSDWVGGFEMIPIYNTKRTTIVFFNEEGKITRSLHCTDGRISGITDMALMGNYYYLGSYFNPFLARVKAS